MRSIKKALSIHDCKAWRLLTVRGRDKSGAASVGAMGLQEAEGG